MGQPRTWHAGGGPRGRSPVYLETPQGGPKAPREESHTVLGTLSEGTTYQGNLPALRGESRPPFQKLDEPLMQPSIRITRERTQKPKTIEGLDIKRINIKEISEIDFIVMNSIYIKKN